ncbi:SAM-dependent methyltransferase [Streptomyces longwoodensis]
MERGRLPRRNIVDISSPNIARLNNYLLGGKDHYAADREASERLLAIAPQARSVAEGAHRFLLRVTSHLAREHKIRQFVVFGAGLPAPVDVHQVAQSVDACSRVVYADDDPLALAHGRAFREDGRRTVMVQADPLQAAPLLSDPAVRRLVDVRLPVAVLMVSVLHQIPETVFPAELLERTARLLAPGSFVTASHLVSEDAWVRRQADAVLREAASGRWGQVRERSEVGRFFGALPLLAPGLVDVTQWRPGSDRAAGRGISAWAEHGAVAMVC